MSELGNVPILQLVDLYTTLSVTCLSSSIETKEAGKPFETNWVNVHGPLEVVSADIELMKKKFLNALRYFGTSF